MEDGKLNEKESGWVKGKQGDDSDEEFDWLHE